MDGRYFEVYRVIIKYKVERALEIYGNAAD